MKRGIALQVGALLLPAGGGIFFLMMSISTAFLLTPQPAPSSTTTMTNSFSSQRSSSSSSIFQSSTAFPVHHLFMAAEDDDITSNNDSEEEAERMKRKAEELREQIRKMEEQLGDSRKQRQQEQQPESPAVEEDTNEGTTSLKGKRVLVTGANGRLGSMVCKYLLRNFPNTEVVACVHYVGEDSPTARGYARLSYEVGAEDGIGQIGAAWSAEDRTATFQFDVETMAGHNLQNLRIVECELLDPIQCQSIVEGCDSVIWCATDFNGNSPRAVSGLNLAFLFRAAANPDKGRVEIEGLQNMAGALKQAKQDKNWNYDGGGVGSSSSNKSNNGDPINFVLVSTGTECFENFETPFGEFNAIKRQGEQMLLNGYPSLSSTVIQLSRFDDNFVPEDLDIMREEIIAENDAVAASAAAAVTDGSDSDKRRREKEENNNKLRRKRALRKINRRDAAKAVVDALIDDELIGKTVQVWTQD